MMEPWQTLVLVGAAIAGYGWLIPQTKKAETSEQVALQSEEAYDQLLEDLETENRELVDAVASFKKEQDETVRRLGQRIRELETQMVEWKVHGPAVESGSAGDLIKTPTIADSGRLDAVSQQTVTPQTAISHTANTQLEAIQTLAPKAPVPEEAISLPIVPQSIRARYAELLELHGRGRSVEQIAKTLGLNKGEVQLILQLAKREEEQHA